MLREGLFIGKFFLSLHDLSRVCNYACMRETKQIKQTIILTNQIVSYHGKDSNKCRIMLYKLKK